MASKKSKHSDTVFKKNEIQKDPFLFKDLTYGQRKKVADFLDIKKADMKYWVDFAELLEVPEDTIAKIDNGPANRESVKAMFLRLKQSKPHMTASKIVEGLRDIRRNDIVVKLDLDEKFLGRQLLDLEDDIWQKLTSEMVGQKCWKELAHQLGFTYEEIKSFEVRGKRQSDSTPTKELIDYLTATRPALTLSMAKDAAERIERHDLAAFLESCVTKVEKSKAETSHGLLRKK